MKNLLKSVLLTFMALFMTALLMIPSAYVVTGESVQVIGASPGQTITYQGTGTPNSNVDLEVSATITVSTYNSGGTTYYRSSLNGVNVPSGSHFSVTASPVDSISVSGSPNWESVLGYTVQGGVSNGEGSVSMGNIPSGSYNIVISGIANGSGSVSITVHASQTQSVGSGGAYTASISTSGLPSTVYSVTQNGMEVAQVYLGVQAPVTPTPTVTPTATAVPSSNNSSMLLPSSSMASYSQGANGFLVGNVSRTSGSASTHLSQTGSAAPGSVATTHIWISPTPVPNGTASTVNDILLAAIGVMVMAIIAMVIVYIKRH